MRTIFNALVIVALANLFAIVGFVAWLGATDRLSRDRIDRIGAMFGETVVAEERRLEQEAAERDALVETAGGVDEQQLVPIQTDELLQQRIREDRLERQALERMRREVDDLKATLARERAEVDRERAELDRDQRLFAEERSKIREIEGSEQFQKALSVLKNIKPAQAKEMLTETLADGEDGMRRSIEFLNALPDRQRAKVVAEFIKDDAPLAADLLERLRARGVETPASGDTTLGTGD